MKIKLLGRVKRWQAKGEANGLGGGWVYKDAMGRVRLAHRPNLKAAAVVLMRIDGTSVRRYADL